MTQQEEPMDDHKLQHLIQASVPDARPLDDTSVDALWHQIESAHFDGVRPVRSTLAPRRGFTTVWRPLIAMAATLAIGFGLGRYSTPTEPALPPVTVVTEAAVPEPLRRSTSRYLDDAALLLASLQQDTSASDTRFTSQAETLLNTTRLLLDSPAAASDPKLRDLLEDLELVLAQVARLRTAASAEDLSFIATALNERDVVPRLRTVAASMSSTED
jgi:hypothetical protein